MEGGRNVALFFLKNIFTLKPLLLLTFRRFSKNNRKKTLLTLLIICKEVLYLNMSNDKKQQKMETYKILNHLGDVVKTVEVKSKEEIEDIIFDLKQYHGFLNQFTYEKIK